jgi:SAM-dependent methyltransferase
MDNKKYYENFDWESVTHEILNPFLVHIKKTIPAGVKNILDVGCGNGVVTNELAREYKVTGLDRSEHALSFVKTEKIHSSSDSIPLPDQSFDLVLSTELLEHLDEPMFQKTISEISRVSREYIMITVPFEENIEKNKIRCPNCGYVYHRGYHLRSFNRSDLEKAFPRCEVLKHHVLGVKVRDYSPFLSRIKHKCTPATSWISFFWVKKDQRNTLCPQCENQFQYLYRFNLLGLLIDLVNILVSPKKPYWQLVLFKKPVGFNGR